MEDIKKSIELLTQQVSKLTENQAMTQQQLAQEFHSQIPQMIAQAVAAEMQRYQQQQTPPRVHSAEFERKVTVDAEYERRFTHETELRKEFQEFCDSYEPVDSVLEHSDDGGPNNDFICDDSDVAAGSEFSEDENGSNVDETNVIVLKEAIDSAEQKDRNVHKTAPEVFDEIPEKYSDVLLKVKKFGSSPEWRDDCTIVDCVHDTYKIGLKGKDLAYYCRIVLTFGAFPRVKLKFNVLFSNKIPTGLKVIIKYSNHGPVDHKLVDKNPNKAVAMFWTAIDAGTSSSMITPHLFNIIQCLVETADRTDGGDSKLRSAAYKTLSGDAADQIMILFLMVFGYGSFTVHAEAMLAIVALAYATGQEFVKYMQEFYSYLEMELQIFEDYHVCSISVGVIGDICCAVNDKILPYYNGIMTHLLNDLSSSELQRSVKSISDYYIAASARFVNQSLWQRVIGVAILHYSYSKKKATNPLPAAPSNAPAKSIVVKQALSVRQDGKMFGVIVMTTPGFSPLWFNSISSLGVKTILKGGVLL